MVLSCQKSVDLRERWHVYPQKDTSLGGIEYSTMDIEDDNSGMFSSPYILNGFGFEGSINTRNKKMRFGGECMILNFDFTFQKDTLELVQEEYGGLFKAFRCGVDCCDKQKDFFSHKSVEINLPIVVDTTTLFARDNFPPSLQYDILFGINKKEYIRNCNSSRTSLIIGDDFAFKHEIPIQYEKHKLKVREELHPRIKIVVYADKNTAVRQMLPALQEVKKLGKEYVLFALRSESVRQDFKVWLKPFYLKELENLEELGESIKVENWLPQLESKRL